LRLGFVVAFLFAQGSSVGVSAGSFGDPEQHATMTKSRSLGRLVPESDRVLLKLSILVVFSAGSLPAAILLDWPRWSRAIGVFGLRTRSKYNPTPAGVAGKGI
jgi:hypothetical protein